MMFRVSFVVLALASVLALNGCTQCSNPAQETAPQEAAPPEFTEDVPAHGGGMEGHEGMEGMEGMEGTEGTEGTEGGADGVDATTNTMDGMADSSAAQ